MTDSEISDLKISDMSVSDPKPTDVEMGDQKKSEAKAADAETDDQKKSDPEPSDPKFGDIKELIIDDRIIELNYSLDEKVRSVIDKIDMVIFEYQAVLGYGKRPATYAINCLNKFKSMDKRIAYTLSSTEESIEDAIEGLKGFHVEEKDITTVTEMIKSYLKENKDTLHDCFFLVGSKKLKKTLQDDGYKIITIDDIMSETMRWDVANLEMLRDKVITQTRSVTAVILSEDDEFSMLTAQAVLYIFEYSDNVTLITSTIRDKKCLSLAHNVVGTRLFVDAIERWAHKKAINLGKPGKYMGEKLMEKYDVKDPSRVLIVGTDIDTDVAFGLNNGCKTLLCISGVAQEEEIEDSDRPMVTMPHLVGEDMQEIYDRLCELY